MSEHEHNDGAAQGGRTPERALGVVHAISEFTREEWDRCAIRREPLAAKIRISKQALGAHQMNQVLKNLNRNPRSLNRIPRHLNQIVKLNQFVQVNHITH